MDVEVWHLPVHIDNCIFCLPRRTVKSSPKKWRKKSPSRTSEGYRLLFIYLDTGNAVIYGPVVGMGPFIDADVESKAQPLCLIVTGTCRSMMKKIVDKFVTVAEDVLFVFSGDEKVRFSFLLMFSRMEIRWFHWSFLNRCSDFSDMYVYVRLLDIL